MKKIKYLFVLLICVFCDIKVNAACSDPNNCILMCSYEETVKKDVTSTCPISTSGFTVPCTPTTTSKNEIELVDIYYYPNNNEYEIVYVGGTKFGNDKIFKGSLETLAANDGIYGADLQEGKCPLDLSVDISALGYTDICIAYDDATCKFSEDESPNGWTKFTYYTSTDQTIKNQKIKTEKTYDFPDEVTKKINASFEKYKNENFVIDETKTYEENPFCQKVYPDNTLTKQEILSYIEKELNNIEEFKGKTIPTWVSSSNPYQSVINYFTTGEGVDLLQKCQTIATNDSTLTDEEKEEIINGLEENFNVFYEDIYEHFENQFHYSLSADFTGPESCVGFLGNKLNHTSPAYYLDLILSVMRYAAIILTIVLSSIDFLKAVTAQDKDLLKKATTNSVKRLIFTVLLFFLPIIIDFVLSLLGAYNTCIS